MATYFISDLHLEEERPDITEAFLRFMDQIQPDADTLYILGDFFESWVGDDENTPLQQSIKQRLKAFSDEGKQLFFMHGNRDFLVREGFASETGATILPDPSVVELCGEQVLLMHGDSLCTQDLEYMKFRETIRNPDFLNLFLMRPLQDRIDTARQIRAMSQANNQNKASDIMDVTPEEVIKELENHQVQTMIHGHTHRPMIHEIEANGQPAKRIVLGDWDQGIWYIKAEENNPLELKQQAF